MISELKKLEAAAAEGPWLSTRVEPKSATDSFNEPYSPWIMGRGPRTVTVGRGTCIHADDMALICALRNKAKELIAVVEAAKELATSNEEYGKKAAGAQYGAVWARYMNAWTVLRAALDALRGEG